MIDHSVFPKTERELSSILTDTTIRDRVRLRRFWDRCRKSQGELRTKQESQFIQRVSKALQLYQSRLAALPNPVTFPEALPVSQRVDEIAQAISENPVIILAGETGSGKTTQLPKICLQLGRGVNGAIGHTQPRRIAATSVANRIAEELDVDLGSCVGYQVRFNDLSQENSLVKLMTDGILLAEIQNDPLLHQYDTIIVDEAHERSLNIDFLLGYLKKILAKRHDLKVIVTSATIDVDRFSRHFDNAPIIEVSGRTYPVDIEYRPWVGEVEDQAQAVVETVEEILTLPKGPAGDILVFMAGERDIRETSQLLRKAQLPNLEILPLYARLSIAEQKRVFESHRGRRVVLATNVAETSITVPGISYVIDPGSARISRYSVRTKVQRLPIEPISQASANQRAGRCGRVSHGTCYRLYSEEDFVSRSEFTDPEIQRTNLASVVLQMLHLKMGDIRQFPFVDKPDHKLISDGYKLLEELQAVNASGQLTEVGKKLATMPIDPRLGRMLLEAQKNNALAEALIIVAALGMQDPRERPAEKQQVADEKHRRFRDENSDFLAYINLWRYVEEQRQEYSQNQWRKQCKKEFLSFLRLREWRELHHQLRLSCKQLGWKENQEPAADEVVHQSLLSGLLSFIGFRNEEASDLPYLGARNSKFAIFPGSSQFKRKPKWIMAAELLETSKLFAHCIARIEPSWILKLSTHLQKHHYYQPHYVAKSGQVMGYDRITLYGLVLSEKRPVNYKDVDAQVAREVFIRSALVEGKYPKNTKARGTFFKHNEQVIESVLELEAKSRRKDILVDDEVIYRFYDERIAQECFNLASFEHWRKQQEKNNPEFLYIPQELVMHHAASHISDAQFPSELEVEGMHLPLTYHFEPGHQDDGVSLGVPAGILHSIPEGRLDWLVPGFLRDKCIAIIKSLPKEWRKKFVPVPHYVDQILPRLKPSNQSLFEALSLELQRMLGSPLPEDIWSQITLDDFYRMNILVLDDAQKVIDRGRDLNLLRQQYRGHVQHTLKNAGEELELDEVTDWTFGDLPEFCQLDQGGIKVKAYPSLVVEQHSIALRMLDNPIESKAQTTRGILALIQMQLSTAIKYLHKHLMKNKDIGLTMVNMGKREEVVSDIIQAAIYECAALNTKLCRTPDEFVSTVSVVQPLLVEQAQKYEATLLESLKLMVEIKNVLKKLRNQFTLVFTVSDIQDQINQLFFKGCFLYSGSPWIEQLPRYLKGILVRLEKAPLDPRKDKMLSEKVAPFWQQHADRLESDGLDTYFMDSAWREYRWMIEEYRVSLFAQTLKTVMPVSDKRLQKAWQSCKN